MPGGGARPNGSGRAGMVLGGGWPCLQRFWCLIYPMVQAWHHLDRRGAILMGSSFPPCAGTLCLLMAPPVPRRFSYFTAGSGGAGPVILQTSFLLMGEDVVAYRKGGDPTPHAIRGGQRASSLPFCPEMLLIWAVEDTVLLRSCPAGLLGADALCLYFGTWPQSSGWPRPLSPCVNSVAPLRYICCAPPAISLLSCVSAQASPFASSRTAEAPPLTSARASASVPSTCCEPSRPSFSCFGVFRMLVDLPGRPPLPFLVVALSSCPLWWGKPCRIPLPSYTELPGCTHSVTGGGTGPTAPQLVSCALPAAATCLAWPGPLAAVGLPARWPPPVPACVGAA